MPKIISIHSFRRGTGKSTIAANLAVLLAVRGLRVCIIDTDVLSPSLHWRFGLSGADIDGSLNDFLLDHRPIEQAAHDLTSRLGPGVKGQLFLVPASDDVMQLARILHEHYDTDRLHDGCQRLIDQLALDVLLVDTHAGLNQDSLASIAISDALIVVLRLEQQDYQGTAVTIDVARQFKVPELVLIANLVPGNFEPHAVAAQLEKTYHCPVSAVVPASDELMTHSNSSPFVLAHAQHPVTLLLTQAANGLAPHR